MIVNVSLFNQWTVSNPGRHEAALDIYRQLFYYKEIIDNQTFHTIQQASASFTT